MSDDERRTLAELAEAGRRFLELHADPEETFTAWVERVNELFYAETGMLAPGCGEPLQIRYSGRESARQRAYEKWVTLRRDRFAHALAAAEKEER